MKVDCVSLTSFCFLSKREAYLKTSGRISLPKQNVFSQEIITRGPYVYFSVCPAFLFMFALLYNFPQGDGDRLPWQQLNVNYSNVCMCGYGHALACAEAMQGQCTLIISQLIIQSLGH